MEQTAVVQKAPVKPMYICLLIAWGIFMLPIPNLGIVAYSLILISFILSIICLFKNDIKNGITGLLLVFIGSPIVFIICRAIFATFFGSASQ